MHPGKYSKYSALVAAILLGAARSSGAADIHWLGDSTLTDDSDVSTNGTPVYAYSLGAPESPIVVNTVSFSSVSNDVNGNYADGNVLIHNFATFTGYGAPTIVPVGSDYYALLNSGGFTTGVGNDIMVTLNVIPGRQYEVELWANDGRLTQGGGEEDVTDANGNLNGLIIHEPYNVTGGLGGEVVAGDFTADATTEAVIVDSQNDTQQLNAFQLRDVTPTPEPASAVFGMGLVVLLFRRRRVHPLRSAPGAILSHGPGQRQV